MSVHLEKATTRNLLDGLRAFVTTFDAQREAARREDALAITQSGEHVARAAQFSDVLPRFQSYGFVTLLALIIEARLSVFCKVVGTEYDMPVDLAHGQGASLENLHGFVTRYLGAEPPEDLWQWIVDIARVRDCITRQAGSVSALPEVERRALFHIARHRPGLAVVSDHLLFNPLPHPARQTEDVLEIRREFCLEAVTAAQGLFGYLYPHRQPAGT